MSDAEDNLPKEEEILEDEDETDSSEEESDDQNEYEDDGFVVNEAEEEGEEGEKEGSDDEVKKTKKKKKRKAFELDEEDYDLLEDNQVTVRATCCSFAVPAHRCVLYLMWAHTSLAAGCMLPLLQPSLAGLHVQQLSGFCKRWQHLSRGFHQPVVDQVTAQLDTGSPEPIAWSLQRETLRAIHNRLGAALPADCQARTCHAAGQAP